MRRILVAVALVLSLIAFSADACSDFTGSDQGTWYGTYQIDYTHTRWQESGYGKTCPDQLTLGTTTTHLVKGTCHK